MQKDNIHIYLNLICSARTVTYLLLSATSDFPFAGVVDRDLSLATSSLADFFTPNSADLFLGQQQKKIDAMVTAMIVEMMAARNVVEISTITV